MGIRINNSLVGVTKLVDFNEHALPTIKFVLQSYNEVNNTLYVQTENSYYDVEDGAIYKIEIVFGDNPIDASTTVVFYGLFESFDIDNFSAYQNDTTKQYECYCVYKDGTFHTSYDVKHILDRYMYLLEPTIYLEGDE